MSNFDNGVSFYSRGSVTVPVNFPEGQKACKWCPFCRKDNDIRYRCFLTNRILYSTNIIPEECPIEFKEEEHEQS